MRFQSMEYFRLVFMLSLTYISLTLGSQVKSIDFPSYNFDFMIS